MEYLRLVHEALADIRVIMEADEVVALTVFPGGLDYDLMEVRGPTPMVATKRGRVLFLHKGQWMEVVAKVPLPKILEG